DRNGILVALDDLAKDTDVDSTVVIYFSGHGGKKDGGYYFCPYKFNSAALQNTAISGQEFKDKIAAIPAKKKLILLDCCHAGGIGSGVKGEGFTKAAVPPEAIELFQQGKGCVVIASSKKDEVSYTGKPYSAFTGALIEALCGQGISEGDSYIMVSDLAMHAARRTPQLTKDKQHPVLRFKEADDFVLAYYAGGEKETKELPFDDLQVDVSEQREMVNQKDELLRTLRDIKMLFVKNRYEQSFSELYLLCEETKIINKFSQRSISIIRKYNYLKKKRESNNIGISNYDCKIEKICKKFELLLVDLHEFIDNNHSALYEKQKILLEKQDDILKEGIINIDDMLTNEEDQLNIEKLEIIKERLKEMRKSFFDMLRIFQSVKE
ncbi:MAG: caspase family protein, partial [Candidatus Electrothrix sp. ATG1]|nr:caspase family protein [Candidatus Electrothrix sp. ATG1]